MTYARSNQNLPEKLKNKVDLQSPVGMNNGRQPNSQPLRDVAAGEKYITSYDGGVIQRSGPDRPGNKLSGYGGAGHSNTSTYSVTVGPLSKMSQDGKINANVYSNPDMSSDAGTVYLSQKTDVDKNFGLAGGNVGTPEGVSAFAAKADSCRMISRYGIKLVTATDDQNSKGNNVVGVRGIDLMAGNTDGKYVPEGYSEEIKYLQSIPKGDNLISYLKELSDRLDKLSSIFDSFVKFQGSLNRSFVNHFHITTPAVPGAPSIAKPDDILNAAHSAISPMISSFVKNPNYENRTNISTMNQNYLSDQGPLFINSKYNKTT